MDELLIEYIRAKYYLMSLKHKKMVNITWFLLLITSWAISFYKNLYILNVINTIISLYVANHIFQQKYKNKN